jgi:hypothetical protein
MLHATCFLFFFLFFFFFFPPFIFLSRCFAVSLHRHGELKNNTEVFSKSKQKIPKKIQKKAGGWVRRTSLVAFSSSS